MRRDRLDVLWVIDGAMNTVMIRLYVDARFVPVLHPDDVVILDNLSSHKAPAAAGTLREAGARLLFFPPCSPDLNRSKCRPRS